MPKKYKRKRERSFGRRLLIIGPLIVLGLSLAWIWKANRVKEYYANMKTLEETRKAIRFEIAQSKNELSKLKSLTSVDSAVTAQLRLTQNVSARIFLDDPVRPSRGGKKYDFVDMDEVADWLESEAVRAGKAAAGNLQGKK